MGQQPYCATCEDRGTPTLMVPDTDFGGWLCPQCEPFEVKLCGKPDERLDRQGRLFGGRD